MNTLSKLLLLTLATGIVACNEKVSPELQGAASTSTTGGSSSGSGGGSVVNPDTFYFRVTNTSDSMLNYRLHKTGVGNAAKDCTVESSTALSSTAYRSNLATYDITCFFETEELSLSFNGINFAVEASPNTCEYVGYGPFSYFDRQPGNSSNTLYEVECAEGDNAPDPAEVDAQLVGTPLAGMGVLCGQMRNPSVSDAMADDDGIVDPGEANFAAPADDTSLCAFKYAGVNCDIGIIDITTFKIETTVTVNAGITTRTPKRTESSRRVSCGGSIGACIDGPLKDEGFAGTSGIKVGPTKRNEAYTKEYSYAPTFETYVSNRRYVNYRRDLASLYIEYGNSDRSSGILSMAYLGSFGDPIYKYTYNPELMAYYADNKRMDGTPLINSTEISNARLTHMKLSPFKIFAQPLAAEPFLGTGSKTNPFYTFYCFDNAFDVKARVRMVVRDWDRVFSLNSTDQSFERISDVDLLPPLAKQDVPYTDEVTGEPDSWNAFNDMADWDDLIDMERDDAGLAYDPSITIWRTYPQPPYDVDPDGVAPFTGTNGFFNPAYFPGDK